MILIYNINAYYRASGRPLGSVWGVFWRPFGGPLEAFGGLWGLFGPSWRHLGRFVAQEVVKNFPKRSQELPKTAPRGPKRQPKASQETPQEGPRGHPNTPKSTLN